MFVQLSEQIWITTKQPGRERQRRARLPSRKLRRVACDFEVPAMFTIADLLFQLSLEHHYIKGHISVFGRGFICFCCLEPNFLHGVSCPYCPEYWRVSSVVPQKNWGVWTHFLIFDPFYWLENQPACDKSCIETAFECSFSFWNPFNLSAYGLFLHDMSEEHIVPKLA